MKGSRLFQILYCILERGTVTAPDLTEQSEVSVRTICRDIDALSAVGIPVCAKSGRGGGICLMERYIGQKNSEIGEFLQRLTAFFSRKRKNRSYLRRFTGSPLWIIWTRNWPQKLRRCFRPGVEKAGCRLISHAGASCRMRMRISGSERMRFSGAGK